MKKILAALLLLSLIMTFAGFAPAEESGVEPKEHFCGDCRYIILEDGTAEIAWYAGGSENLTVPEQLDGIPVTSIGEGAFSYCYTLISVVIPDGVTRIGNGAFASCIQLASVTFPDSVAEIGTNPFTFCSNLTDINVSSGHPYLAAIGSVLFSKPDKRLICYPRSVKANSYVIPNGIRIIGDYAFYDNGSLTTVTIPDSVVCIGNGAFYSADSLTTVTIPDSVTEVGSNPFKDCRELTNLYVSPDHPYLAMYDGVLFSKPDRRLICYPRSFREKSYTVPDGTEIIGNEAFYNCSSLISFTIPDSVTSIGDFAFYGSFITSVTIPDSITSIGANPFADCSMLTEINVSSGHPVLAVIDDVLISKPDMRLVSFPIDSGGESVVVPEGIRIIGDYAFDNCRNVMAVTIPDGVTVIGKRAFNSCSSLTTLNIPSSVTGIGEYAFSGCSSLLSITIPDSVSRISDFAFSYSSSLASVTIPGNLMSIGKSAFAYDGSLAFVVIQDGVKLIGERAFCDCSSLASVIVPESLTGIGLNAFAVYRNKRYIPNPALTLIVPADSLTEQYCRKYGYSYDYTDAFDWLNN